MSNPCLPNPTNGWAVANFMGDILLGTISETRVGAIVKWMRNNLVSPMSFNTDETQDEQIEKEFAGFASTYKLRLVELTIKSAPHKPKPRTIIDEAIQLHECVAKMWEMTQPISIVTVDKRSVDILCMKAMSVINHVLPHAPGRIPAWDGSMSLNQEIVRAEAEVIPKPPKTTDQKTWARFLTSYGVGFSYYEGLGAKSTGPSLALVADGHPRVTGRAGKGASIKFNKDQTFSHIELYDLD